MGLIDLTTFKTLFDSTDITICEITETGIIPIESDDNSINKLEYQKRMYLDFPCSERSLFDWAKCIDDWESSCDELPKNGFMARLSKDFVDKWVLDNEMRMAWFFESGFIPDDINRVTNWAHWLTLKTWNKEQASHLICNIDPHQDKKYSAFNYLIDRMPPIESQSPIKWMEWFDNNGYLGAAPKRLLDWHELKAPFKQQFPLLIKIHYNHTTVKLATVQNYS